MSASSKKKLRKEQNAANMTQKQQAAKKEARKLKIYTATFWIVLVLCVALVASIALRTPIDALVNRLTTSVVVGEHDLSAVEMNYFYIDAINNYCSQYSSWISYILDTSTPLSQQYYDSENTTTWADYFVELACDNAKNTYAMYDAAVAAGHTLSEEEQAAVDELYDSMDSTAETYGYSSAGDYLTAVYGNGASEKSYKEYYEVNVLASSYYSAYAEDLENSYTDNNLREYEADKLYEFNSYSYAYHYMTVDSFATGGTTDEDGNTTYTDEEIAAAEEALKAAADGLAVSDNNTVEKLNAAIAEMEHAMEETETEEATTEDTEDAENTEDAEDTEEEEHTHSTCTEKSDVLYSSVSTIMQEWIRSEDRAEGDITAIPYTTTSTDDDGNEVETLKGYYVILFQGVNDNTYALKNVRHILVAFEGGTTDSTTGTTTYSDEEKAAAKTEAEALLEQWKAGDATEDSFAALANEKSDDGDGTTGGLYEDIYPGQMVTTFEDWCYDESREAGDTGVIESEYGYHVMYFVGDSETNYRDYMITYTMLNEDLEEWQTALNDAMTLTEKNTEKFNRDITLNSGS